MTSAFIRSEFSPADSVNVLMEVSTSVHQIQRRAIHRLKRPAWRQILRAGILQSPRNAAISIEKLQQPCLLNKAPHSIKFGGMTAFFPWSMQTACRSLGQSRKTFSSSFNKMIINSIIIVVVVVVVVAMPVEGKLHV